MGEEVRITEYDTRSGEDDCRISEWESGLPNIDDLVSLSHALVPPELASAFSITREPVRSMFDVNRASETTLANLSGKQNASVFNNLNNFKSFGDEKGHYDVVVEDDEGEGEGEGEGSRKLRRVDSGGGGGEEGDSVLRAEDSTSARTNTSKRPRLAWTPQLHKRFVDVVAHLGVKNAAPKTIMQLMNVEGLTRENVASHLQKYRLYLKRKSVLSNEGPSSSDHLFASAPVPPQSLHEWSGNGNGNGNGTVPYLPQMVPMPYPPAPQMMGHPGGGGYHHGYDPYNMMMQQRDWAGNKFGSVSPYQHLMTPNDK